MTDHIRGQLGGGAAAAASPLDEELAAFGAALGANDMANIEHHLQVAVASGGSRSQLQEAVAVAAARVGALMRYFVMGSALGSFAGGFPDDATVYEENYAHLGQAHLLAERQQEINESAFTVGLESLIDGLELRYRASARPDHPRRRPGHFSSPKPTPPSPHASAPRGWRPASRRTDAWSSTGPGSRPRRAQARDPSRSHAGHPDRHPDPG